MNSIDFRPWFWYFVLLSLLAAMCSCTSVKYVPVETVHTEYKDKVQRDSIYVLDSVLFYTKGDTFFKDRWRIEYKDKIIRDSVFCTDSVQVPYPVEKVLTKWQQLKMDIGGVAVGISLFLLLATTGWIVYAMRKK